jgi:hypothetical protein
MSWALTCCRVVGKQLHPSGQSCASATCAVLAETILEHPTQVFDSFVCAACRMQAGGTSTSVVDRTVAAPADGKAVDVYIGFPKGDFAPREGRKGRVIKDDPSKYPAKEDLGFFAGATGASEAPTAMLPGGRGLSCCFCVGLAVVLLVQPQVANKQRTLALQVAGLEVRRGCGSCESRYSVRSPAARLWAPRSPVLRRLRRLCSHLPPRVVSHPSMLDTARSECCSVRRIAAAAAAQPAMFLPSLPCNKNLFCRFL